MRVQLKFPWFTPGAKQATLLAPGEHDMPDEWRDKLPRHAVVIGEEKLPEKVAEVAAPGEKAPDEAAPAEDFKAQLLREQAEGDSFAKAQAIHSASAEKPKLKPKRSK